LADRLRAPYFEGRFTRLLVDLNRTNDHLRVVPADAGGVVIAMNAKLDGEARRARLRGFWTEHTQAVRVAVARRVASHRACLHLAVHSFTPVLDGNVRACDIGLLFDSARARERRVAAFLRSAVEEARLSCRFNYPYRGASNGLVTSLRRELGGAYLGFEIEINQALLVDVRGRSEVLARLVEGAQTAAS
jgi:predicted N-formylglutamate amidohydrolase